MAQSYFAGLKVVDFTGELGPYAAKMFAGLGAEVIHLEPMDGDPLRRTGPFYQNRQTGDASLPFCYYNAGKRGMALNLEQEGGRKIFRQLCSGADLLLESFVPGYLAQLGLGYEELCRDNARLVHCSITPFGNVGPLAGTPGSELTLAAMSGFLYLAGIGNEKPVRSPDNQTFRMAEAYAGVGCAIALYSARRTGKGQFVDVACIEAAAGALENAAQFWDLEGKVRRGRGREAGTATIHPCADGYLAIVAIMGKNKLMWEPFVRWMREEAVDEWQLFDDDKWIESAYRESAEGYATFCRVFERYTMKHDKRYLYETGQRFSVAVTPVSNGKDLLENPQLLYRKYWQTARNETLGGDVVYPGAPYEFGELQWRLGRNAPRLGEHSSEILREMGYSYEDISALAKVERFMPNSQERALEGIVVCDFSWVGAGPIATSVLAQCGAEVIKIESLKRPDILRKGEPFKDGDNRGMDRSGYFANRNANKRDIALNMGHPRAREVAVRLIEKSDIVINNFRVGQMEKWNLGWEEVKKINPRAIYVTMSLQGITGPHAEYMGFGVNLNALCGLTARAGFPGRPPFGTGTNYTDHVMVPTHTLFGIMAALLEREATGHGQTVTVSQLEAAISMTPSDAMAYAANGEVLAPMGCGDPQAAPHGVYTTLGYRKWIGIAVFGEDEWAGLKKTMGNPAWADDPKFATLASRQQHQEQLDARIEAWTAGQYSDWLMQALQANGVKAGTVRDAREVVDDEHLRRRGFWAYLDHPVVGRTLYNRAPMLFSRTPLRMETAAPSIGQHTQEVLSGMLGYTDEEIKTMTREEVLV